MNVIKQHTLWVGWRVGCGTPVSSPTALTAGTMHLFSLQEGKYLYSVWVYWPSTK